jgi:hypothetical protein
LKGKTNVPKKGEMRFPPPPPPVEPSAQVPDLEQAQQG